MTRFLFRVSVHIKKIKSFLVFLQEKCSLKLTLLYTVLGTRLEALGLGPVLLRLCLLDGAKVRGPRDSPALRLGLSLFVLLLRVDLLITKRLRGRSWACPRKLDTGASMGIKPIKPPVLL